MPEQDEELVALKRKRTILEARIATFSTFIISLRKYKDKLTTRLYSTVETRLNEFNTLGEEFENIQSQIETIASATDLLKELDERATIEKTYFEFTAEANVLLATKTNIPVAQQSNSSLIAQNAQVVSPAATLIPQTLGVKLPTIELPKFGGKYEEWLEFRDIFKSLIHQNDRITDMQRYHYLRVSLIGDAAEVIKSLELCEANYGIAWALLCRRYDKSPMLVHNHIKSIFDLTSIKKESAPQLRTMVDSVNKHLQALTILGQDVSGWDLIVMHIITSKLDATTNREWEQSKCAEKLPSLADLTSFLKKRADLLEVLDSKSSTSTSAKVAEPIQHQKKMFNNYKHPISRSFKITQNYSSSSCTYCKGNHYISSCQKLLMWSVQDRIANITKSNLCINCLRAGHSAKECKSPFSCRKCQLRHHSLLHLENAPTSSVANVNSTNTNTRAQQNTDETASTVQCSAASVGTCTSVLLPTAVVLVSGSDGHTHTARILLDSGSQANFITIAMANKLKAIRSKINTAVVGINEGILNIKEKCTVEIKSRLNNFSFSITCLITDTLCGQLNQTSCHNRTQLDIPVNLKLADPNYFGPAEIDILVGSEWFWRLLSIGNHTVGNHGTVLQKSRLGWLVAGPIDFELRKHRTTCNVAKVCDDLTHDLLTKFWSMEECATHELEAGNSNAELHFQQTYSRDENGRFIVQFPFKETINTIGESKEQALRRFFKLEQKLIRNQDLYQAYKAFIHEYISLGHMSRVTNDPNTAFYLPHHGVQNITSDTTKLRVVFDGSARASCGTSINDHQLVGPTIQPELFSILLRFRSMKFIVMADIKQMYRQVLIKQDQRVYQRILWRESDTEPIDMFELNTVTYGLAASPFLAIRCLEQLARDIEAQNTKLAALIRRCFYVDNLIAGFATVDEAVQICKQLANLLASGCFPLRQWASNSLEIDAKLSEFYDDSHQAQSDLHTFDNKGVTKTLGLQWHRKDDTLAFHVHIAPSSRLSKRTMLSQIASIFDPLGLVAPCTIKAKIMIQRLWQEQLTWDESVPQDIANEWRQYLATLDTLNAIRSPRYVLANDNKSIHLHGFCDASKAAYGAAIYLVCENSDGQYISNLLCAKSRVAPLKAQTIPRLELAAAVVLARLFTVVLRELPIQPDSFSLWSDSMVALYWIHSESNTFKQFVSNRVNEIRESTAIATWRHVPTKENPADFLSRGLSAEKLSTTSLWWRGPEWICGSPAGWPTAAFRVSDDVPDTDDTSQLELKTSQSITVMSVSTIDDVFPITKFSSFRTINRIATYSLRFIRNCRVAKSNRETGHLKRSELRDALTQLIKCVQSVEFSQVIKTLQRKGHAQGALSSLTPFIDERGVIRVGGRLRNANISYDSRHQLLLPAKNHLTRLIIAHEHLRTLHAGPLATLHSVRLRFWPISGRNTVRKMINECAICRRARPPHNQQLMGDLPSARVNQSHPFSQCGVDFAGPYFIKRFSGRGSTCYKAYVALFVCMITRAIHLELVTSLETAAFLACLRRFAARRGRPNVIYSDNATNFRGARNELYNYIKQNAETLMSAAAEDGVTWKFIPALSPNFGGLWEGGVKSLKHHLTREIGDRRLTYEDFTTYLHQVEGILNSRPITPLSTDPNDLSPLTPAHFLIGRTLNAIPDEEQLSEIPEGRLGRYQRIQAMLQGFWKRWSVDYLNQLQQRCKWRKASGTPPTKGDLVLLHDPNQPPMRWRTGRIVEVHEGPDERVRVVSIQTSNGIVKRAISKVCPLLPAQDKRN